MPYTHNVPSTQDMTYKCKRKQQKTFQETFLFFFDGYLNMLTGLFYIKDISSLLIMIFELWYDCTFEEEKNVCDYKPVWTRFDNAECKIMQNKIVGIEFFFQILACCAALCTVLTTNSCYLHWQAVFE